MTRQPNRLYGSILPRLGSPRFEPLAHLSALALALILPPLATPASAAEGERKYETRTYTTQRANDPPRMDGDLSDACWQQVDWGTDFVEWEPKEGDSPTRQTAFKILYDDANLYVAYRAYDDPREVDDLLARRDWFPGDWVEINIDSHNDKRTAFSFTSSVSGARGDEFVSEDGNNWDGNWDPVWELRSRIDDEGWTAEVRIPFSQLRFSEQEEQVWGIQVQRRLYRKEERSLWQPFSKDESGWVSRFGELRGIQGVRPPRRVEILPYAAADAMRGEAVPGDPFQDGSDNNVHAGVDGKLGVTGDLTLDFTVNPDFGQVEADPSEVNLSAFETFFSEKRPFFIEGSNILDYPIAPAVTGGSFTADNLFYSRRIGAAPHFHPDLEDGEYADVPGTSSIIGALKLSGKTAGGLSVGVLNSMVAREKAEIDDQGVRRQETVEPFTNYFVGRLQQEFDEGNTRFGGIVTAVNRDTGEPQLAALHRSAYTAGLDFRHEWARKSWYVAANATASRVAGDEKALFLTQTSSARYFQRPDNGHESVDTTRTSLAGQAGSLRLARAGGSGAFRFETGAAFRTPGFEINDMGYLRRADEINQFTWGQYSVRKPFAVFRRFSWNANQWLDWDFGGDLLDRQANTNFNTNFKNNWACGAGITHTWDITSNTVLRGGPSMRLAPATNAEAWVNTDQRKTVALGFGGSWSGEGSGSTTRYYDGWVDLFLQVTNTLRITVSPWYARGEPQLQYVTTRGYGGGRYLLANLKQETGAVTLRLDYTITPNLTVQYYGSPFVSSGAYTQFKRVTAPKAEGYDDRFQTFTDDEIVRDDDGYHVDEDGDGAVDYSFGNPDFNFRDFNSNLVLRWEYQPGSLLYLVWSQARSDFAPYGQFAFRSDLQDLFDTSPENIFLIKISKWFSL